MRLYIYVATALFTAGAGALAGWQVQEWRYGAKEADRLEEVRRDRMRAEKNIDTAAVAHEKDKTKIVTEFITITETVERVVREPFYAASDAPACLDDSGLRQLSAALGAATTASEPARAVPRPRSTD